jgi:hypothetical protein
MPMRFHNSYLHAVQRCICRTIMTTATARAAENVTTTEAARRRVGRVGPVGSRLAWPSDGTTRRASGTHGLRCNSPLLS